MIRMKNFHHQQQLDAAKSVGLTKAALALRTKPRMKIWANRRTLESQEKLDLTSNYITK